ncbi:flagellar motor switch protein FliM [human gut metagenome]|uniref:Flagellar motor switch protein FliM n=1 Tax=human gut metagenome TaxID=408170 RepID=K1RFK8_9ZZZZ
MSEGDLDVDQIQGEDEKQVKNYDFSRPTKFSKEHLRTLEIIFETLQPTDLYEPSGISAQERAGIGSKFGNGYVQ